MDWFEILMHLTDISGMPISIVRDGVLEKSTQELDYLPKLLPHIPPEIIGTSRGVECQLTNDLLCFGVIALADEDACAVFGPISVLSCDNHQAQRILRTYGLPLVETGKLLTYLESVPTWSLRRFANFLTFANWLLRGEKIAPADLMPEDIITEDTSIAPVAAQTKQAAYHNAATYEKQLFSMIRFGKYEQMVEFLKNGPYTGTEGTLASDMFRHQKNLVIASVTLAARCAVSGEVDYDNAMSLADTYIQKVEIAADTRALVSLHHSMLRRYAKMVSDKKINGAHSAIAARVRTYVEENVAEEILVGDVAQYLGLSKAYLSTQFKKETGITLNNFINQIKLEEAKPSM